jgi:DNA-binding NarL/FixJ family response regulator
MDRPLLIADDELIVCNTLQRYYARTRSVTVARSVAEAVALITTTPRWCGAIIDYRFPDGDGLALLEAFRMHVGQAPVLMLTGVHARRVNHRASELGAQFVMKPAPNSVLRAFGSRLDERMAPGEVGREIVRLVTEYGLSPGEARIVEEAVRGVGRTELAEHLGLAESTIKTQVGRIVAKCQVLQLSDVVRIVWERAARADP